MSIVAISGPRVDDFYSPRNIFVLGAETDLLVDIPRERKLMRPWRARKIVAQSVSSPKTKIYAL